MLDRSTSGEVKGFSLLVGRVRIPHGLPIKWVSNPLKTRDCL